MHPFLTIFSKIINRFIGTLVNHTTCIDLPRNQCTLKYIDQWQRVPFEHIGIADFHAGPYTVNNLYQDKCHTGTT